MTRRKALVVAGVGALTTMSAGAARAQAPRPAREIRLMALGDSLTAGYGLPPGQGFVPRLEAALRARGWNVRVLDAGVSGDTSAGGRARLDWALADNPDAAIVELGANDMLRGMPPAQMEANLDDVLRRLAARNLPTLLAGMLAAPNLGAEYVNAFRQVFVTLSRRHDVVFYPFFLDGVAGDAALNQPDGIHPSARGVDVIVTRMLPSVETLLGRVRG